jgi:hypothetical protein
MKKNDNEVICKDIFSKYLVKLFPQMQQEWQDHPNGKNKPPDFNLVTGQDTFAVEITQFEDMREYEGEKIRIGTAEAFRIRFVKELEKKATSLGILRGTYGIDFSLSRLVKPTINVKRAIRNQVLEYIDNSREQEQAPSISLEYNLKSVGHIHKFSNVSKKIFPLFSDAAWVKSPEILQHAHKALKDTLDKKAIKLKNEHVPQPWILLFGNTYPFASKETYMDYVKHSIVDSLKLFHSVFIIMFNGTSFMLYSCRKGWT